MIATKPIDLRARLKDYLDNAFNGEPVIVSEREYNELTKAKRNAEYMEKIAESIENHAKGDTISYVEDFSIIFFRAVHSCSLSFSFLRKSLWRSPLVSPTFRQVFFTAASSAVMDVP